MKKLKILNFRDIERTILAFNFKIYVGNETDEDYEWIIAEPLGTSYQLKLNRTSIHDFYEMGLYGEVPTTKFHSTNQKLTSSMITRSVINSRDEFLYNIECLIKTQQA